jgi:hypothetical protein
MVLVKPPDQLVSVTLSLDTSAYASGDVLAATQEIANVFKVASQVRLGSLLLLDKDDQAGALDVLFLRSNTAIGTENAAYSPTDAIAAEILAVVVIAGADYYDMTNNQIVQKTLTAGPGMGMMLAPTSGDSLYVAAVSRDTKTYTASGLVLTLGLLGS